jgi:hypothetical protein
MGKAIVRICRRKCSVSKTNWIAGLSTNNPELGATQLAGAINDKPRVSIKRNLLNVKF